MKYVPIKANAVDAEHVKAVVTKYANEKRALVAKRTKILNDIYTTIKIPNAVNSLKASSKLQNLWKKLEPVLLAIAELDDNFSRDDTVLNREGRSAYSRRAYVSRDVYEALSASMPQLLRDVFSSFEYAKTVLRWFGQSSGTKGMPTTAQFIPPRSQLMFKAQL